MTFAHGGFVLVLEEIKPLVTQCRSRIIVAPDCEMNVSTQVLVSNGRWIRLAAVAVLASLILSGCGKGNGNATGTDDPVMAGQLTQLTKELHHTMVGRKLNRDFDEFVVLSKVEVPPPPPGKKYAISEKWKVILVNK